MEDRADTNALIMNAPRRFSNTVVLREARRSSEDRLEKLHCRRLEKRAGPPSELRPLAEKPDEETKFEEAVEWCGGHGAGISMPPASYRSGTSNLWVQGGELLTLRGANFPNS